MESKGRLIDVTKDWQTGRFRLTFAVDRDISGELEEIEKNDLRIKAVRWRERRSVDANAMLWACIGDIARALGADKWQIYLTLLRRYGKYTYICVKPDAVEAVKRQWRESEEIGEVDIHGMRAVQLLCYYGSSTYDTKEFSALLDGAVAEMKEMGLAPPLTADMKRALEAWERKHEKVEKQTDG